MKRKQIPQITDAAWFPPFLTRCVHEFMSWFVLKVNASKPFLPVIQEGLQYADAIVVLDKNAGAGFETVRDFLPADIPVYHEDMEHCRADQSGLYLSVNAFHKLNADQAKNLLNTIATKGHPVVIVEGNNDSLWQVFGMTVIVPLTVLLTAPFVKPFRLERLLFTYLIPVLPIVTLIDGFLALFKLYAPADLDELTTSIAQPGYQWRSGKMDNGRGGKIIYLKGHAGM
jgi:hypothetical protein